MADRVFKCYKEGCDFVGSAPKPRKSLTEHFNTSGHKEASDKVKAAAKYAEKSGAVTATSAKAADTFIDDLARAADKLRKQISEGEAFIARQAELDKVKTEVKTAKDHLAKIEKMLPKPAATPANA